MKGKKPKSSLNPEKGRYAKQATRRSPTICRGNPGCGRGGKKNELWRIELSACRFQGGQAKWGGRWLALRRGGGLIRVVDGEKKECQNGIFFL